MLALLACISSVKLHATSSTLCVLLLSNVSYVTCPMFVHEIKKFKIVLLLREYHKNFQHPRILPTLLFSLIVLFEINPESAWVTDT